MVTQSTLDSLERQRVRRVAKAERASGFKEGRYTMDGLLCEVKVTFYPTTAWWLNVAGKQRVRLMQADWVRLVPYARAGQESGVTKP